MKYLNSTHIDEIGINWIDIIQVLAQSVHSINQGDFAQPVKPYLRYGDLKNRIIAMPAFLGGNISFAGIKWIASFPDNIEKNIPRAHSTMILNDPNSGKPMGILNSAIVSGIRTAGVSGLILDNYLSNKKNKYQQLNVGIVGFGPIGRLHLDMISSLLNEKINNIYLYDIKGINKNEISPSIVDHIIDCKSWQDVYTNSDIFITCTVSEARYINIEPKLGSLQLNVSLRDYEPEIKHFVKYMIVDNWDEVCRENTDIELMHKKLSLKQEHTFSIVDVICHNILKDLKDDDIVMFNPMGMGVFDIAAAAYYYNKSIEMGVGIDLVD